MFWVYTMASRNRVIYIGVTNNLPARVMEHKSGCVPGFTSKYHVTQLVYFEEHSIAALAIARERQLKGWRRSKKVALIEKENPEWKDLAEGGVSFPVMRRYW